MSKFNKGKAYHGSMVISGGELRGATDRTDYFYFFCPRCPDKEIMRLLDYEVRHEQPENPYDESLSPKTSKGFTLALQLHCLKCGLEDFVKVSNLGWQGGSHAAALGSQP